MTRIAVVGADHWHMQRHCDAFTKAGATIVSLQTDDASTGERWQAQIAGAGGDCRAFSSIDEMLDDRAVDLVLAMPRHDRTRDVLWQLVDRRIPFVVEKPVGTSAEALDGIVEQAEEIGLFASVAYINKYGRIWQALDALNLGDPTFARFRIVNGSPERYRADSVGWVLEPGLGGGGALRNIGSHAVEAFLSIAHGAVEIVGVAASNAQFNLHVEDHILALLRDEAGLIGVIEAGYTLPDVDGTDQIWTVGGPGYEFTESHERISCRLADSESTAPTIDILGRYDAFAADTLERLASGLPPLSTLRDARAVLRVVDSIYDRALETRAPRSSTQAPRVQAPPVHAPIVHTPTTHSYAPHTDKGVRT